MVLPMKLLMFLGQSKRWRVHWWEQHGIVAGHQLSQLVFGCWSLGSLLLATNIRNFEQTAVHSSRPIQSRSRNTCQSDVWAA